MKRAKDNEFLNKLADLIDEYAAELTYTTDDDGINIIIDDRTIFAGFIFDGDDIRKGMQ